MEVGDHRRGREKRRQREEGERKEQFYGFRVLPQNRHLEIVQDEHLVQQQDKGKIFIKKGPRTTRPLDTIIQISGLSMRIQDLREFLLQIIQK